MQRENMQITLKAARVNAGYTQKKVAKNLGVCASTVVSWEAGKTYPSPKYINPICNLYGVRFDDLKFLS